MTLTEFIMNFKSKIFNIYLNMHGPYLKLFMKLCFFRGKECGVWNEVSSNKKYNMNKEMDGNFIQIFFP